MDMKHDILDEDLKQIGTKVMRLHEKQAKHHEEIEALNLHER